MIPIPRIGFTDFESIEQDPFWNTGDSKELKIHSIHAYPAKFPAFITTKVLDYYKQTTGKIPSAIADVFCGCGTTAIESKRNGIRFWGCDLNPVATLIARVKSDSYQIELVKKYEQEIVDTFHTCVVNQPYTDANERLIYWYYQEQYEDLDRLKTAIQRTVYENKKYLDFFLCAFSNILKPTSKWLTKSIKPQIDPNKKPTNVLNAFIEQVKKMSSAILELGKIPEVEAHIQRGDFLHETTKAPKVDLVVTSPPYVTSYEYADLHQLSALWLGYTDDYRSLREGSIGSKHHTINLGSIFPHLKPAGFLATSELYEKSKAKAKSVARYYFDIQQTVEKVFSMLNPGGIAVFVIGNTEYKGVRIDNAKHLAESLYDAGFYEVLATKRKISNKILTPYRDKEGRFTSSKNGRKIYAEEFILVGKKSE